LQNTNDKATSNAAAAASPSNSSISDSQTQQQPRSGGGFDVWTKSMRIDFKHSATTDLELRFSFGGEERMNAILRELQEKGEEENSIYCDYDG